MEAVGGDSKSNDKSGEKIGVRWFRSRVIEGDDGFNSRAGTGCVNWQ